MALGHNLASTWRKRPTLLGLALVMLSGGCSVPIARDLAEADANRVVVALERNGIVAEKEPGDQESKHWQVLVSRDQASRAAAILAAEALPPPHSPNVLEALGDQALVPTTESEQARLVVGMAGELERTLRSIDRVLDARVHLSIPHQDPLVESDSIKSPTASVLLRYRGATPPIASSEVQRLVAGAIAGMPAEGVTLVALPSPAKATADPVLVKIGPFAVATGSAKKLRWVLSASLLLNMALCLLSLFLWRRSRREPLPNSRPKSVSSTVAGHDSD